ncbi:cupin domain-containing protein [Halalkalicoccus salilacus]|uniref:cupin domain-containing protein n=1 Tax=Halalkalicoccus TaxID=332246 RepID=UPI002F962224
MEHVAKPDREFDEVVEGVQLADLATGARTSMKFWRIEPGATLPTHRHHNEQIGFVVSGVLTAVLEDGERELRPGDSYAFASGELHGAENRGEEPAVGVGVLSPPRSEPQWGATAQETRENPEPTRAESDD